MESLAIDFSDVTSCSASSSTAAVIDSYSSDTIPTDLRLGTKLRVISRKPFLWMKDATVSGVVPVRVIGQQQHEGMQYFLKNIAANFDSTATDSTADSSPMALLEAASLYWQFPCFPWLSTYPRADSLVNTNARTNPTIPTLSLVFTRGSRSAMDRMFRPVVSFVEESFDDVDTPGEESLSCFHASEGRRHVAVIIPCPIGLRHYLKSEGVVYELIRRKHRFKNTKSSEKLRSTRHKDSKSSLDSTGSQSLPPSFSFESKTAADGSQEDHDKENIASQTHSDGSPEKADLSGDHEWLENIGMSPRNTAKLKRYKSLGATSKLNDEDSQSNPGVEEVAGVLVKGAEVQTLYNLLQSSRICRSIAGPHANLPPTLVAAQPFLYAQMNALKKTSQVVRRKVSEYVLELEGPILPHSLPLVAAFIRHTRLCQDDPVIIRVNDRSVCNGMNDVDSDLYDWNELRIDKEKVSWDKI
ncbi:hypothetical protein KIN20_000733 [Parelaphostrongylus tenuis]|uniref:Uncharacterized protein n=1 Tax=Parelaphostrongylus tenuis TaxID=148309 RepID=A0AAD5MDQ8_PARTN|nr:hypothetical protein KIN20_000733 [Parelaphostrongylus tenuis]